MSLPGNARWLVHFPAAFLFSSHLKHLGPRLLLITSPCSSPSPKNFHGNLLIPAGASGSHQAAREEPLTHVPQANDCDFHWGEE